MTRADKIKEYVKERYGVNLNNDIMEMTAFRFEGCDGFMCPPECVHERGASDCNKCRYKDFWEQEDDDVLPNS